MKKEQHEGLTSLRNRTDSRTVQVDIARENRELQPITVSVGATAYDDGPFPAPALSISAQYQALSRDEWEQIKTAADRAFAGYDRYWGKEPSK